MQFFSHPEGYTTPNNSNGFDYVYQYKDHLGNIRLSYADNVLKNGTIEQNEIIEENNYYPFGLKHKGYNTGVGTGGNSVAQRWKFGGNELQDEIVAGSSLEWYDISARNYDPALGRWMNLDPLADKYYDLSPYSYVANNPMLFVDKDGKEIDISGLNKTQRKAFGKFLGTKQGQRFLLLYGSANQVVLGHKVGPTGGRLSNHYVAFRSKKGRGGKTKTRFVNRNTRKDISFNQLSNKNISGTLSFEVLIGEDENEIEATETIGHEVFVHVESIAEGFGQVVSDYNSGDVTKEAEERGVSKNQVLLERVNGIIGGEGTKKDHKLFVNGKKVNYEEFIKELGSLYKKESEKGKKNAKENED